MNDKPEPQEHHLYIPYEEAEVSPGKEDDFEVSEMKIGFGGQAFKRSELCYQAKYYVRYFEYYLSSAMGPPGSEFILDNRVNVDHQTLHQSPEVVKEISNYRIVRKVCHRKMDITSFHIL